MATPLASLITRSRDLMNAQIALGDIFWADDELLRYMNGAIDDLYRRLKDNQQDDFLVEDMTNVSTAVGARALVGVPENVAEIRGIRPRTPAAYPNLFFFPGKWTDYTFQNLETNDAVDPSLGATVHYVMVGTGGPVAAVQILIAPTLQAIVPLTFGYVASREEITDPDLVNPIPGQSDMALVYYTVAHGLGRAPHGGQPGLGPRAEWMALFEQEATKITVATTPRQSDEPEYAEALYEPYWN